ncbi:Hpt domain-containing protein [Thalassotalea sp. ND16A]|uniref:Hpt domain-containing protein n=1 Tax=Thalassotalea sp. ND16A TaxID=1535422 RepID=UPI00051A7D55|nr:Hpt domain-containing protein [Thalassotalea sp. ND16A]KGJ99297.1 hypothetical protein ND16A_3818 [Thalassotalea sp. ND16A]
MDFLDDTLIEQYLDVLGFDVFLQTVALYVEQSSIYLQQLDQAIEQQDYAMWQESCHILKSASGNTGLKQVFSKAGELEYSTQEFTKLAQGLAELKQLNKVSIERIQKRLA